jgi:predicted transposase YbfD/YdcC
VGGDAAGERPTIIAVDGKTSRRSHAPGKGRMPLHTVPAWATGQRLVLGREATEAKSNEITAIPLLPQRLDLHGTLVTIDAMGTQNAIAETMLNGGGDYVLALKENWAATYAEVRRPSPISPPAGTSSAAQTIDADHDRIEIRRHAIAMGWTGCSLIGATLTSSASLASLRSPWSRARPSAMAPLGGRSGFVAAPAGSTTCRPSPGSPATSGGSKTGCTGAGRRVPRRPRTSALGP